MFRPILTPQIRMSLHNGMLHTLVVQIRVVALREAVAFGERLGLMLPTVASGRGVVQDVCQGGRMQYGRCWLWVAVSVCLVALLGCGKKAGQQIDPGRFEGLSITMTTSLRDHDSRGMDASGPRNGCPDDAGWARRSWPRADENVRAALEASASRTLTLFTAFQHPQGAPVESNPSISCVAEGVAQPARHSDRRRLPLPRQADAPGRKPAVLLSSRGLRPDGGGRRVPCSGDGTGLPPAKIVKNEYFAALRKGYVLLMI